MTIAYHLSRKTECLSFVKYCKLLQTRKLCRNEAICIHRQVLLSVVCLKYFYIFLFLLFLFLSRSILYILYLSIVDHNSCTLIKHL